MPIIFHLDMDAFFVACEVLQNPQLAGKPVVVGSDPMGGKGRGVVSTASYEARKFGLHSAMPISIAYRKCPDCIFLPVNYPLYTDMSRKVFSLVSQYALKIERVSIDEAFFTTNDKDYDGAEATAKKIKSAIRKEGLTCSIGIGQNKIVAKIASDFQKPDGLTVVPPEKTKKFLAPMNVRKLPGVGPKTEAYLRSIGIEEIRDITKNAAAMRSIGKLGQSLIWIAEGGGPDSIEDEKGAKSISREITFQKDTADRKEIEAAVRDIAEDLNATLSRHNVSFRSVAVKVRYAGFETHLKQKTLKFSANGKGIISSLAMELMSPFLGKKKIRLVGVRLSGFDSAKITMKKFFDEGQQKRT